MEDLEFTIDLERHEQEIKKMSLRDLESIQRNIFRKTGSEVYMGFDNGKPKIF